MIGYCKAASIEDIYEMYYSNGYSVNQIADLLDISVEYVEEVLEGVE